MPKKIQEKEIIQVYLKRIMKFFISFFNIMKLNNPSVSNAAEIPNETMTKEEKEAKEKEAKEREASQTLEHSDKMSSKFAEVGRNIILALIAGSWLLLRLSIKNEYALWFIKIALVLAFIYLLIDLIYYCRTMYVYWKFVEFDSKKRTIYVKDEQDAFDRQTKMKSCFMTVSIVKTVLLFISIALIILFVFLSGLSIPNPT